MNIQLTNRKLGELASSYPDLIDLFYQTGIDFYCNGDKSINEWIALHNLNTTSVKKLLKQMERIIIKNDITRKTVPYSIESLKELCNYITEVYHSGLAQQTIEINLLFTEAAKTKKKINPRLTEAEEIIKRLLTDLKNHTGKEETILFPLIRYMEDCKRFNEKPHLGRRRQLNKILDLLNNDHRFSADLLGQAIEILNGFHTNTDLEESNSRLVAKLILFQKELHKHIHLENNILFPKAAELEEHLFSIKKR